MSEDETSGALHVIPDTNVLMHAKPLAVLPWAELGREDIVIILVGTVVREVDKLKNGQGRPRKIARDISSSVREMLQPGREIQQLMTKPVQVRKRLELRSPSDSLHPSLRLDHADQALINHALKLAQDGLDVLLLTDDTICFATAQEVGVPVMLPPEHWAREPESDDAAKENHRLNQRIKELELAEPVVEVVFNDGTKPIAALSAVIWKWPALLETEVAELLAVVRTECPRASSFEKEGPNSASVTMSSAVDRIRRMSTIGALGQNRYEPPTEAEIEEYKTVSYPEWLEEIAEQLTSIHQDLQSRIKLPECRVTFANTGTRPAQGALVQVKARGSFEVLNLEDDGDAGEEAPEAVKLLALPLPPTPPRGTYRAVGFGSQIDAFSRSTSFLSDVLPLSRPSYPPQREADAFYWRTGRREAGRLLELECESWRHSHDALELRLQIQPDAIEPMTAAIEAKVAATNLSKPAVTRLPVSIVVEEQNTFQEARRLVEALVEHARRSGKL